MGKAVIEEFRKNKYSAISVDLNKNDHADHNVLLEGKSLDDDIKKVTQDLNAIKLNGTTWPLSLFAVLSLTRLQQSIVFYALLVHGKEALSCQITWVRVSTE